MRRSLLPLLVVLGAFTVTGLAGCGSGSAPTQPQPSPPTPTPTATPTPPALACNPTPPPLYGIKVTIFDDSPGRKILDSKPLVMNIDGYCARVGPGSVTQTFCDTRPEGDLERTACDNMATGRSPATGRWGPTWTWNGKPCDGENFTSCANHQDNQYMAIAKTTGDYVACAAPDVPVHPDGQACGGKTIK